MRPFVSSTRTAPLCEASGILHSLLLPIRTDQRRSRTGALPRSDYGRLVTCEMETLDGRPASVAQFRRTRQPGPRRHMPQPVLVGCLTEQSPSAQVVCAG